MPPTSPAESIVGAGATATQKLVVQMNFRGWRTFVYCCAVAVIALAVAFRFYAPQFVLGGVCAKWHLLNEDSVTVGAAEVKLPYNWWVCSKSAAGVQFCRIPSSNEDYFGSVFLRKRSIPFVELTHYPREKVINGEKMTRSSAVTVQNVGGKHAYGIWYRCMSSRSQKCKDLWVLTIPSRGIVVVADARRTDTSLIKSELISRIKFIRDSETRQRRFRDIRSLPPFGEVATPRRDPIIGPLSDAAFR
jgi:hypothetical protein